jgi:hypothetical protein
MSTEPGSSGDMISVVVDTPEKVLDVVDAWLEDLVGTANNAG